MSGNNYLLDTNFILGILRADLAVLGLISSRQIQANQCFYSAITRMELLGYQGITVDEERLIREKLDHITYLPLTKEIEDAVIELRRLCKIKLPDAIIAATTRCFGLELLTRDQHLLSVLGKLSAPQTRNK
ncbi:type II toxin-antitoxin system VapC family toxin [Chlorobium sp. KB01]|uniref:type II toxin-antitoxin system VapC family toxin n=1 Tax=Chlorobium sp. KB01 TaxID=1917528 RepID=UPI0009774CBB|nr:type II toxin-antitoxin system VapC family toxin [Chlorobium sp. KB01]